MMTAVGVIELTSIAKGIEVTDRMLKANSVELIESKSICPGKYIVIIAGNVSEVENSIKIGMELARSFFVDQVVIPNVAEDVLYALRGIPEYSDFKSIGVMEFFSITGAIYAADAAVKAADLAIVNLRLGFALGGKSFVVLTGDLAAVEAGVRAGKELGEKNGLMFSMAVIPSPVKELLEKLV